MEEPTLNEFEASLQKILALLDEAAADTESLRPGVPTPEQTVEKIRRSIREAKIHVGDNKIRVTQLQEKLRDLPEYRPHKPAVAPVEVPVDPEPVEEDKELHKGKKNK